MYEFSRAIYRELAGEIIEQPGTAPHRTNHERVLRACETAVERLASDRHYFAQPTRTLFREIRVYLPISSQPRALQIIEHYLALADEYLRRLPKNGLDINGNPLQCRASTRKGSPCQRTPLPRNGYCPSHQHLADSEQLPTRIAA
jgi:hypothetical protein